MYLGRLREWTRGVLSREIALISVCGVVYLTNIPCGTRFGAIYYCTVRVKLDRLLENSYVFY
jgi:hypothetical protein